MFARALIVLLVVLNLGVALWWATRPAADAEPAVLAHEEGPRLFLLGEVPVGRQPSAPDMPAAPIDDAGAPAPQAAAAEAGTRCFALGPFADAAAAGRARAALAGPAIRQARVREQVVAVRGWNVTMSPLADRAAATQMATRLRDAGFEDLFVLSSGTSANGIALGRYGSESSARQRVASLRAAGFEAVANPIGDGGARHWLDVAADRDYDAAAAQRTSGAAGREPLDCAALR